MPPAGPARPSVTRAARARVGIDREPPGRMTDETLAVSTSTFTRHATTGVPDEPPTPRELPTRTPDDDDVPATPPTEPAPVPVQDPPAEPGVVPQIV